MALTENVSNRLNALRDMINSKRDRASGMYERIGIEPAVAGGVYAMPDDVKQAALTVRPGSGYPVASVENTAYTSTPAQERTDPALTRVN